MYKRQVFCINSYWDDIEVIKNIPIGIYAKNSYPKKTDKTIGIGTKDVNLVINNTNISSGNWIYVDTNGIAISQNELKF